jgi:hypothetical protein
LKPWSTCPVTFHAGKSSILQAILNKMIVAEGRVEVGGTIAYVPQSPWVQNLSLRDNILFGMPFDQEKYKAVVHACALELDLKILPNGACIWHCKCSCADTAYWPYTLLTARHTCHLLVGPTGSLQDLTALEQNICCLLGAQMPSSRPLDTCEMSNVRCDAC